MPTAHHGDIELHYEAFGSPDDPTLLLVCGLGMQSVGYADELMEAFVAHGLQAVRYDNRDSGLSSDGPDGYRLSDMAADGMAVLDALGVERAHIFGVSMGGMIVQTMAIEHRHRVRSMVSMMSSTGERAYGQPSPAAYEQLTAPPPTTRDEAIAASVAAARAWGSPDFFNEEFSRRQAAAAFDRAFRPEGTARQYAAILADRSSRVEGLQHLDVPTLVIHGTADPLIDVSGGQRTAELIPGARLELIEGMGHEIPGALVGRVVGLVTEFIDTVGS